ncbi:MAG TPA: ATP-binding protein [Xanthobacteraceae bacterium]
MRLPEVTRSVTFRWGLAVAGIYVLFVLALFAAIYWQTNRYLTVRSDEVVTKQAEVLARADAHELIDTVNLLPRQNPRRVEHAGLFAADGRRMAGDIAGIPPGLALDGIAQAAMILAGLDTPVAQAVRAAGRRLPGGEVLVIGRNVDEIVEISAIVGETLAAGLLPALFLSVAVGMLLSLRAQRRVAEVNRSVQRIVAGDLRQRLPARGSEDPFDRLAAIVNGMLERIEALIQEIAGVGDDIAHDLRTPLTRMRVALERGRANARSLDEARTVIDRAIAGLDQSLAIVTALLRIAEIEHTRRLAGFSDVALADIVREVCDLYEPIAEEKGVRLSVDLAARPIVQGDRDLLLEAVANLADNAIKFTPAGGNVELGLLSRDGESVVRVGDTGPGISEAERDLVVRRFYRSDRSRQSRGVGLGLSLVMAIVKLHGFGLTLTSGPGLVAEIVCPPAAGATRRNES